MWWLMQWTEYLLSSVVAETRPVVLQVISDCYTAAVNDRGEQL